MAAPRKIKATVTDVTYYERGVTFFQLKPEGSCRYRAGQFLHLTMDEYDPSFNWPESRVFSIANSPYRKDVVEILVSPKGAFTQQMVQDLKPGSQVWLKLPYGEFNFSEAENKNVVLIAGGTGISPFVPFLEELLGQKHSSKTISLYYGVQKKELIVFGELLEQTTRQISNFSCYLYLQEDAPETYLGNKNGILPIKDILCETVDLGDTVYYLSGPKPMIESFLASYSKFGVSAQQVFYDKWE